MTRYLAEGLPSEGFEVKPERVKRGIQVYLIQWKCSPACSRRRVLVYHSLDRQNSMDTAAFYNYSVYWEAAGGAARELCAL